MSNNCHKVGASFTRLLVIPSVFGDGYFVGWNVTSEIRDEQGGLIDTVACEWLDPLTTRNLKLRVVDTTAWVPDSLAFIDVKFVRMSDGEVMPTTTAEIRIERAITQ